MKWHNGSIETAMAKAEKLDAILFIYVYPENSSLTKEVNEQFFTPLPEGSWASSLDVVDLYNENLVSVKMTAQAARRELGNTYDLSKPIFLWMNSQNKQPIRGDVISSIILEDLDLENISREILSNEFEKTGKSHPAYEFENFKTIIENNNCDDLFCSYNIMHRIFLKMPENQKSLMYDEISYNPGEIGSAELKWLMKEDDFLNEEKEDRMEVFENALRYTYYKNTPDINSLTYDDIEEGYSKYANDNMLKPLGNYAEIFKQYLIENGEGFGFQNAQEKKSIPKTHLKIELVDRFKIDSSDATISNNKYRIRFDSYNGVDFYDSDISNYVKKVEKLNNKLGFSLNNTINKKTGVYNSTILEFSNEENTQRKFIIFGDSAFLGTAVVNTIVSGTKIEQSDVDNILKSLEFSYLKKVDLEKYAKFKFEDDENGWSFSNIEDNKIFNFKNASTKDDISLIQFHFGKNNEDLKNSSEYQSSEWLKGYKNAQITEQGFYQLNKINGYKTLIDFRAVDNLNIELIYQFLFTSYSYHYRFTAYGEKYDEQTIKRIEDFFNNFKLKVRPDVIYYNSDDKVCKENDASYYLVVNFNENDKPIGTSTIYYISDEKSSEANFDYIDKTNFHKNTYKGKYKGYYKNGNIKYEGYSDDNYIGSFTKYYENGTIKYKGFLQIGENKRIGKWLIYDEQGNLVEEKKYN